MSLKDRIEPLSSVVTEKQVREIAGKFGTPAYVYSQKILEEQADKVLAFPNEFGLTARFAMKSNPNANILKIFHNKGIQIDASSSFEVQRAINVGIPSKDILLTSQQVFDESELMRLVDSGIEYNACSLLQLKRYGVDSRPYGISFPSPSKEVSVRVNPGLGSGGTNRTNTGGPASSFGIWKESLSTMLNIADFYNLDITRLHTHIGSGSDPTVWQNVALMSLGIASKIISAGHNVQTINLGGGYKVARMSDGSDGESTDLQKCGEPVKEAFADFANKTGRKLKLEIEPGTFLVANAGCLIARVADLKRTSEYNFLITDSGMTEVTRPSLYGAQHPITIVGERDGWRRTTEEYIVSGHCCESGDILTPEQGNPEELKPRRLLTAYKGDFVVIGGTGAYCAAMSTKNYNSYPEAPEVLINRLGESKEIRKRQSLKQILQNEIQLE